MPTVAEQGVPGYDCGFWAGIVGPKGMASDIVARLQRDFARALRDPAVADYLAKTGSIPV